MRHALRLTLVGAAVIGFAGVLGPAHVPALAGGDDISGVVNGPDGPEAGVWVIAETTDLETRFRKIVVTDDAGRYLVPDLPAAGYEVWVRGYGLVDSEKQQAHPGAEVTFVARAAPTPQAAAEIYPASYWYSLLEVPPSSDFPGTGPNGNGIGPEIRTQAHWIDRLKDGCELCHQMGNKATRDIPDLNRYDSSAEAWDSRVQVAGSAHLMNTYFTWMGRRRAAQTFAEWSDRIRGGAVPPSPPRPQGLERNLVLTMWGWSSAQSSVHDNVATDKRNPRLFPNGPVYGIGGGNFVVVDPVAHRARTLPLPEGVGSGHNPMFDAKGRVWLTTQMRPSENPTWCRDSDHPSVRWFPLERSNRQLSYYDPQTEEFALIDTCYMTHHLQFAEDADDTLWLSGDFDVIGWVNTKHYDETGDGRAAQGWCPTVLDTNGDGRITRPWNEPGDPIDPAHDTRITGVGAPNFEHTSFRYGIIPNPVDDSVWVASPGTPGAIVRLVRGSRPPETCAAEIYEPPFENPRVDPSRWGFSPRGIDVDRQGVIWTALSGSGHLASFDRRKCQVLNGPTATGQHCPEGWTLYQTPGPRMAGVEGSANAEFHYYDWVDQFDTLGLGANVPIANGTGSDSLLALIPATGEWVTMRVPYPLGFYTRGLNGRIDDPDGGWKGRGVWASNDTGAVWHTEGGRRMTTEIVRFQIRPNPLAD